ncbi:C-type lectin domain family 4 member M-like [Syngnathoides biaculeatus]|uniref:C-type lectin domain family 4 member M-like n=1 Tax=Syngnathoides biaculeatus TaxID=300417 RepID=UPI002ADD6C24|nr:C-type lectin domain family 4 member M-like [Syngnathoides biaculeatus]
MDGGAGSGKEASAKEDGSGKESSPKEPSPKEASPQEPSPQEPSPQEPRPKEPSPKEPSPKEPSPKEPIPKEPVVTEPSVKETNPKEPNQKEANGKGAAVHKQHSVPEPKRVSAESIEMSVLYDVPVKEDDSKCKCSCCMPGQVCCCFLGFLIMFISILSGLYVSYSKLDQLKEQLNSSEEIIRLHINTLLDHIPKKMESIEIQLDDLFQQHRKLKEYLRSIDNEYSGLVVLNTSVQMSELLLKYRKLEDMTSVVAELKAAEALLREQHRLLSRGQDKQTDLIYLYFCGADGAEKVPLMCCKNGWAKHASNCYGISDGEKTWEEAQSDCKANKSELAKIDGAKEQEFLTKLVHAYKEQKKIKPEKFNTYGAWIGLSASNGHFRWTDDSALSAETFWKSRKPRKRNEDCVAIVPPPDTKGVGWYNSWNALLCDEKRYYLCQSCVFCEKDSK